ncbi:MAG: dienelactone hydrolase family protein [Deltaproteobacteria bacterium]|nr:dienelactone hydrolase family protein [Deltaproteobacteria bacterium]
MASSMVEFPADGRTATGYLSLPASGHGPGVLVIQEYWGLVDHIKQVADRFAAAGFAALAPDLYRGESASGPDDAGRRLMELDIPDASRQLGGAAAYLLAHASVTPKKVAAVGFCMGGKLALHAAGEYPESICAVVDFYGVHPKAEPRLDRLSGPVQTHFAEHDDYIPVAQAHDLVARLRAAGVEVEDHLYDAQHAFFNDHRPEVYDAAAAKLAWDRTLAFLRKALA